VPAAVDVIITMLLISYPYPWPTEVSCVGDFFPRSVLVVYWSC